MRYAEGSVLRVLFDPALGQASAVAATPAAGGGRPGFDVELAEWDSDWFGFSDFDRAVEALAAVAADTAGGAFEIRLHGNPGRLAAAAQQVMLRCQRLAGSRNAALDGELCERVLASHRRLHDLARPQHAASHAHSLDTWQWLLRLDPQAGLAPQLAALFHDAGVADSIGAGSRQAAGGARPLATHGAWMTDELLADLGFDLATRVRVHRLLADRRSAPDAAGPATGAVAAAPHVLPMRPEEAALLDEADGLSFLSLGSSDHLDAYGSEATARLLAGILACVRPTSRLWLRKLRLRGTVARLIDADLARAGGSAARLLEAVPEAIPSVPARALLPGGGAAPALSATVKARMRLAAGMAGGAGIVPNRVSGLLARAAVLGNLSARPAGPAGAATAPRTAASAPVAAGGRIRLVALAGGKAFPSRRSSPVTGHPL